MSGPVTMTLGAFAFESHGFGFTDLGRDLDTGWTDIKIAQDWDALQWLGPSKEEVEIKGVLFPERFGGLTQLAGIRSLAISGTPMPLISLGGNVFGLFVVIGIKEDQELFNAAGSPRKDKYTIRLRRYPGLGLSAISRSIRLFT